VILVKHINNLFQLRQGYDLPALNFSADEIEAIVVGLSLV
jgi:predicted DNA-binding transcriptional regulator YafY